MRRRHPLVTFGLVAAASLVLSAIASDFDRSGRVDFNDFLLFAGGYNRSQGDPEFDSRFDLDGSGRVEFGDFLIFAQAFGQSDPVLDQLKEYRTRAEVDSIGQRVLGEYGDSALAAIGILDVTKPPYNADATGETDVTDILQQAILDARDARLVCFLPVGTYRVSDTLEGIQGHIDSRSDPSGEFRLRNDDYPCVIRGDRIGTTRIVLDPGAPGFGDASTPKPVIFLNARRWVEPYDLQPNVSFDQMILDLEIDLSGNAGAVGIDHQAAQGSVTEDVHIVATGAFAGFRGVPGSGGGITRVSVEGGQYGFFIGEAPPLSRFSGAQPSPVISHVTLTGQTELSVMYHGRGPLTLVGARIEGAGIRTQGHAWAPWDGALNVVDSHISLSQGSVAISGNRPVVMSNVYVEGAEILVAIDDVDSIASIDASGTHVVNLAVTVGDTHPIWTDGRSSVDAIADLEAIAEPPPADLQSRHTWPSPIPWYGESNVVSVKDEAFGATGDGLTDDTDALQAAIDGGGNVFVPKGVYKISRPLVLGSNVSMFGVGNTYSVISPMEDTGDFTDASNPSPLIETVDDAAATSTISFLKLHGYIAGSYALHWRLGRDSVVRDVKFKRWPWQSSDPGNHPLVLIDGNGGGRWFILHGGSTFNQEAGFRHFLVKGTREPLVFYMFNPEHGVGDYQSEFDDVQNVDIFGMKAETIGAGGQGARVTLYVHDSQNVRVFGYGGNASADLASSLLLFEQCSDFLLANVAPQHVSFGEPPDTWFSLIDQPTSGPPLRTPGTEWLALYRRGTP